MTAHPIDEEAEAGHDHEHGGIFGPRSELIFALLSGAFLTVGFAIEKLVDRAAEWIPITCYLAAYFFGGFYTVREAIEKIRKRKFEIDTLMLVAATGAAFLGVFAEGALLLFLFSLGHALEKCAMGRAKQAIKALAELLGLGQHPQASQSQRRLVDRETYETHCSAA